MLQSTERRALVAPLMIVFLFVGLTGVATRTSSRWVPQWCPTVPTVTSTTFAETTFPATTQPRTTSAPKTTTSRPAITPTTAPATTAPATTTTTAPATTAGFPDDTNTGTVGTLRPWPYGYTTSQITLPTETIDGVAYQLIDSYRIDLPAGVYLNLDSPRVIIRNTAVATQSTISNTSAMVQGHGVQTLVVQGSSFDGGPQFQRGVQADNGDVFVSSSRFRNTGEAGIEKNDRSATSSLVVSDSYFTGTKGWPRGQHVDGIQIGGAKSVTIHHNTVLVEPYGGADGDTSYVSNSALGLWAELGNVGSVTVDGNLLAGGGRTIYLEQKSPFSWQGPVRVTGNVFDTRFGPSAAVWGPLYPSGLPADLTWSGNTFSDGRPLSLASAQRDYR